MGKEMEITQIAAEIQKKINQLEKGRDILNERAKNKAEKIADYDKKMAITIIKLKNGGVCEIDGEVVSGSIPVTTMEKIARGIALLAISGFLGDVSGIMK